MLESLFPELSLRQALILRMVAHGYDNKYISTYLIINQRTVEYHVQRLIKLFDVNNSNHHDKRTRLAHLFYKRIQQSVFLAMESY